VKRNFSEEIRMARISANLSQALLALDIGRSQFWLSAAERGRARLSEETADFILAEIARLARIKPAPRPKSLPSRIELANARRSR
jgi:hypothetical protein